MAMLTTVDASAASAELVLAERGHESATVVVRQGASACEQRAAEEFCHHVREMTGVELRRIDDAAPLPELAVVIGDTRHTASLAKDVDVSALGDEGFRLKASGRRLLVLGGAGRGPLYGVYELLERFGGCAWYSDQFAVVPKRESLVVPNTLDEVQLPAFRLRSQNCARGVRGADWTVRNKQNSEWLDERLGGGRFRFDPVLGKCHTFNALLPPEKWFDSHPEYFSMVDGVRVKHQTQLCLTNPDVLRLCTEKVLERIAESYPKGVRYYGISPNDWMNWCRCPKCHELDLRERSLSGSLIAFVNAIAEQVEQRHPDVVIQTLAYTYARRPPLNLRPRRNVQVCLCTFECDFYRSIAESRALENRQTRHDLKTWSRGERPLSVWDYSDDFTCWMHPWPNLLAMRDNLRLYRDNHVDQVFELGDGGSAGDVWTDIRAWLTAKWLWNPDLALEPLLECCLRDNFGPAAGEARTYLLALHASVRDTRRIPMGCFASLGSHTIDDEVLKSGAELFATAAEKARGTQYEDRVARARAAIEFVRAMRGHARPFLGSRVERVDCGEYLRQREGARRVVAQLDKLRLSDDRRRDELYRRAIRQFASSEPPAQPVRRLNFEDWWLLGSQVYEKLDGREDPSARDGRAIFLSGRPETGVVWFDLGALDYDRDALLAIRVRIRTSGGKGDGSIFRAGVFNRRKGRSRTYLVPKSRLAEVDGRYVWYTLRPVRPGFGDALWVSPARRDGAPDVWIDCVEVVQVGP